MKKSIAIAAGVLLCALVGVTTYLVLYHAPKKDLQLTVEALRHVSSWHEEYNGPTGVEGTWVHSISDVVCPQGRYSVSDETDAASKTTHFENFRAGEDIYILVGDRWQKWAGGVNECVSGPALRGFGIALPLETILSQADVHRGRDRLIGGEACRDYDVKSAWREFTLCVNQTDHLPREIVSSQFKDENGEFVKPERAVYSKWNALGASDLPAGIPGN